MRGDREVEKRAGQGIANGKRNIVVCMYHFCLYVCIYLCMYVYMYVCMILSTDS